MADAVHLEALRTLLDGYRVSQAIHAAAELGIADLLAEGPRTTAELAAATSSHEASLYRLLRALAAEQVFHELPDRRFELSARAEYLRTDVDGSLAGWARYVGSAAYRAAWGDLTHSIRTGENAFTHVHGEDVWSYRAKRPGANETFNRAMASSSAASARAATAAYDFTAFGTIVDVGGGTGSVLGAILRAAPEADGVLFDQAHVVTQATLTLERLGVADRCRLVAGDFFESVPAGGDAYVLRMIIHDWEDDDAVRILANVRAAMASDGKVLIIEQVVGPPNEGPIAKFSDLNMLVAPGGRERTADEYGDILGRAGLAPLRIVPAGGFGIVEARAA